MTELRAENLKFIRSSLFNGREKYKELYGKIDKNEQ